MVKFDYLLFCEDVIIDAQKRASLINTFDTINSTQFPAINHRFKVMFRLASNVTKPTSKELEFKLLLTTDKGKELAKAEGSQKVVLNPDEGLASAIDLSGLVFEKPGKYFIQLFLNGEELAKKVLRVNEQK
jgi:hypothetical protein